VLQLVNTPDIYEENKYQRRNLLLYHCLLELGYQKSTYLNRKYIHLLKPLNYRDLNTT
jgi:hypothetical protein